MRVSMARFPFQKTLDDLRFQIPAVDRSEGHPRAGDRPLLETRRQRPAARPARRRQDAPRRRARAQGLRARRPRPVYDRDRAHRHARQSPGRGSARRAAQDPGAAAAADHRRDRLHPDRPAGRQSLLSAGVAPLRAGRHHPDEQSEPRRLGRGLRRPRHRLGASSIACCTTRSPSTSGATATGSRRR